MSDEDSRLLLSGNEAIARGALEAGVGFCASYPGTPSTEITTVLFKSAEKFDIYVEWSVNEKVALEAAAGASWAGIPALCAMKSLGLNVASDFLLNLNLSGSGPGGLVIVVCDDPRGHSSSNEQDSRFYARAAYLPLLEPTTSQEAKDLMKIAFSVSKKYQIPVLVRSTTRLSHSTAVVTLGKAEKQKKKAHEEMPERLYNVPNPHLRHRDLEATVGEAQNELEEMGLNSLKKGDNSDSLIIASGVSYRYAEEALEILGMDSVDLARLVTTYPLPVNDIIQWVEGKSRIVFFEEVDPFIEIQIQALLAELEYCGRDNKPLIYYGKQNGFVPFYGELSTDFVIESLSKIFDIEAEMDEELDNARKKAKELLIPRPLAFCAGCTHRNVYWAIRKLRKRLKHKLVVAGDIGCYSLGVFYDEAMNSMQAMGSGIGTASGLGQLHRFGFDKKVIAVAGDSTFYHACIPGLINARHKNADLTFLILDNSTTAMTGFQEHPGIRKIGSSLTPVSIEKLVKAIEPDMFRNVDATDIDALTDSLHEAVKMDGLKVLILNSICRLEQKVATDAGRRVLVTEQDCRGESCRICVSEFACPALEWDEEKDIAAVVEHECIRCGACIVVCPHDAIRREG